MQLINSKPFEAILVEWTVPMQRCLPRTIQWSLWKHCRSILYAIVLIGLIFESTMGEDSRDTSKWNDDDSLGYRQAIQAANRIDYWIERKLKEAGVEASVLIDNEGFIRRAHLDLWGTNPEPSTVQSYCQDTSIDKREKMVWRLASAPSASRRMADIWTDMLVPEQGGAVVPAQRESLRRWIFRRFAENQRYDRIVGDLLIAKGNPTDEPTAFFTSLELKPEKLAERTSRVFLGVALDCAQCHDHPFESWKQKDFWALAAYFAQVTTSNRNASRMEEVNVMDVDQGDVVLPETETIIAPKPLIESLGSNNGFGSRRQQLAIWLTSKENQLFLRATVNRIWAMMHGRGIVEPVDDMGGKAIASHPEMLDELAHLLRDSNFDVRMVVAAIAMSRTYARSGNHEGSPPGSELFACMLPKPLSARQVAQCLRQAAREKQPSANTPDNWVRIAEQLGEMRGANSNYTGGVVQSLLIQHSPLVETLVDQSSSRLLQAIHAPHLAPEDRLQWMYLAILSRKPSLKEVTQCAPYYNRKSDDPSKIEDWESDLLWALINSSEFAMTP